MLSPSFARVLYVALLLAATIVNTSCGDGSGTATLHVKALTSLVPGPEFAIVDTALLDPANLDGEPLRTAPMKTATFGEAYQRGVEVATFENVAFGDVYVRVKLRRADESLLIQRMLQTHVGKDGTIVVPLTRDCVNVECPLPGGSAALSQCIGGTCEDPRCDPTTDEGRMFCTHVTLCNTPEECDPVADCAQRECVQGLCQPSMLENVCTDEQWCNPEDGCLSLMLTRRPDAGIADASIDAPKGEDAGEDASQEDASIDGTIVSLPDAALMDHADVEVDGATTPDAAPDAPISSTDCRLSACPFWQYCDSADGVCKNGCDDISDCSLGGGFCNTSIHTCECSSGSHMCDTTCKRNDDIHACGPSCTDCPDDPHGAPLCTSSTCVVVCEDDYRMCGSQCARCPAEAALTACSADACVATACFSGYTLVDGDCIGDCRINASLCNSETQYCDSMDGLCKSGCSSNTQCTADFDECNTSTHACVCSLGAHDCSGVCSDNHDVDSCGASCTPCPTDAHGTATCNGTTCGLTCDSGYLLSGGACIAIPAAGTGTYVKASNIDAGDNFGSAIAISSDGTTMVVGAMNEASCAVTVGGAQTNGCVGQGAAYVFTRSGSTWTQQAYLKASNGEAGDLFGAAVSISDNGNVIAVGANAEDACTISGPTNNGCATAGAVYVFTRSAGTWTQQVYLKASNPDAYDYFGVLLDVSGDGNTIAVGAPGESSCATGVGGAQTNGCSSSGAVYIFTYASSTWSQQAYIKPSNTGNNDYFGWGGVQLSQDGNALVVGSATEDSGTTTINGDGSNNSAAESGAAYVFRRSGSTWSQQAYLKAPDAVAGDYFGTSAAISTDGNRVLIGARGESSCSSSPSSIPSTATGCSNAGAAYIFDYAMSNWSFTQYLKASNTASGDWFSYQFIALSGDGTRAIVGSQNESACSSGLNGSETVRMCTNSGAAYTFDSFEGHWVRRDYVKANSADAGDAFGYNMDISRDGQWFAVGAANESSCSTTSTNNACSGAGAVYVYGW